MSEVILQLQKSQALEEMRLYWWRTFNIVKSCDDKNKKTADTTSLGLEQVGGCFVMILIGLGSSIFISLSEFLYKAFQRSKVTKVRRFTDISYLFENVFIFKKIFDNQKLTKTVSPYILLSLSCSSRRGRFAKGSSEKSYPAVLIQKHL